jgi:hypothetical protein
LDDKLSKDVMVANGNGDCLYICLFYSGFFMMNGGSTGGQVHALKAFSVLAGRVLRRLYYNFIQQHRKVNLRLKTWLGQDEETGTDMGMMTMSDTLETNIRQMDSTGMATTNSDDESYDEVMAAYMGQYYYGSVLELKILCSLTPGLRIHILNKDGRMMHVCSGDHSDSAHTFRLLNTGGAGKGSHFDLYKWAAVKRESQHVFNPRTSLLYVLVSKFFFNCLTVSSVVSPAVHSTLIIPARGLHINLSTVYSFSAALFLVGFCLAFTAFTGVLLGRSTGESGSLVA